MKRKVFKKGTAVASAIFMAASLTGCGKDSSITIPKAEISQEKYDELSNVYDIICDDEGNPIDLGGMEIIIRDWWSSGEPDESTNDYTEARAEYRAWIQKAYNFSIAQIAISDWESTPSDFVEFVSSGGDGRNYLWVMREDDLTVTAMMQGMAYDLNTLDCLSFSDTKFQRNKLHEIYSINNSIYGMYVGYSEPRTGVYFNKDVLEAAGIDPESIYDMQQDGTWTWDEFDRLMGIVQRDTDGDGLDDVYGVTTNEGVMTKAAVYSNGGDFVGKDENGQFTYRLEDPETMEALKWVVEMYDKYDDHDPEGANWDYYKDEFLNGQVAFLVEDEYAGTPGNYLYDAEFDIGFVMFPQGPQAEKCVNCWSNNPVFIPNVYDEDTAWKIAFAYNLYTNEPAGYEDYVDLSAARAGVFDSRAVDETITMMMQNEHGLISYTAMMPNVNVSEFLWAVNPGTDIEGMIKEYSEAFRALVTDANSMQNAAD
ncbi:MAG: extracellular solute-binding protein [Lachnospiraceae bacterium]|nr:extracellular solute-binding protein [Lachnospiraceae bacterium]